MVLACVNHQVREVCDEVVHVGLHVFKPGGVVGVVAHQVAQFGHRDVGNQGFPIGELFFQLGQDDAGYPAQGCVALRFAAQLELVGVVQSDADVGECSLGLPEPGLRQGQSVVPGFVWRVRGIVFCRRSLCLGAGGSGQRPVGVRRW